MVETINLRIWRMLARIITSIKDPILLLCWMILMMW